MCYLLFPSKAVNVLRELEWQNGSWILPPSLSFQDDFVMPKAPPNGKRRREDALEDRPGPATKRLKTDITNWTTPRYPWLASIQNASEVGIEHVLALCGLGPLAKTPLCPNKFQKRADSEGSVVEVSDGEDETTHNCSKVKCRNNPYCLNYLGQERWENEGQSRTGNLRVKPDGVTDAAKKAYLTRKSVSKDPKSRMRNDGVPCGLKVRSLGSWRVRSSESWSESWCDLLRQCCSPGMLHSPRPCYLFNQ